jgi:hypothetical protein
MMISRGGGLLSLSPDTAGASGKPDPLSGQKRFLRYDAAALGGA